MTPCKPSSPILQGLVVAATALLAATLAACNEHRRLSDHAAVELNEPTLTHRIGFADKGEVLRIELPPRGAGLGRDQVADIQRFLARFKAEATGPLAVSISNRARVAGAVAPALNDLGYALAEAGIEPRQMRRSRHDDSPHSAHIRLSYVRPVAQAPECGHFQRDLGVEHERVHYPNFGCATQRNLAGMVANARDLQRPQDEQPRSAERRSQTWSLYIAPEKDSASGSEPKAKATGTTKKE